MSDVVYLSMDGVLGHLGFSQVVRLIERVSMRGVSVSLVSLERREDLLDRETIEEVRHRLAVCGARWIFDSYETGGGALSAARNQSLLSVLCSRELGHAGGRAVIHARGYHGALAALPVTVRTGAPWIFDARGAWIDERLEEGRWFRRTPILRAARAVERLLYEQASSVVTLTSLHRDNLKEWRKAGRIWEVIPTCADFDEFRPAQSHDSVRMESARERLGPGFLVGIVGSMNRAYRPVETARLARQILDRRVDARVCVLSKQHDAWSKCLVAEGVPRDKIVVANVPHYEMPFYLASLGCVLMVLQPYSVAKVGAMPTKLAECFASEVPVCAFGCNDEVVDWVERVGGGVVLGGLDSDSLRLASERMVDLAAGGARERARAHFSLEAGAERYCEIYSRLGVKWQPKN